MGQISAVLTMCRRLKRKTKKKNTYKKVGKADAPLTAAQFFPYFRFVFY